MPQNVTATQYDCAVAKRVHRKRIAYALWFLESTDITVTSGISDSHTLEFVAPTFRAHDGTRH